MYGKTKSGPAPSDAQAREKLAMYVYEYLLHVGAGKAAQLFMNEIGWNKSIQLSDPPGFLHSWWCVFWDLYCASPEKRDTCDHSADAKAFHDYSSSAAHLNSLPVDGGMAHPVGLPSGYYPQYNSVNTTRFSGQPHPGMQGPAGPQPMMSGVDHSRRGHMMGMNRMPHPRGLPPSSMNPYAAEQFQQGFNPMRIPSTSMSGHPGAGHPGAGHPGAGHPGAVHPGAGHSGVPMAPMHARSPWTNPSASSGPSSVGPPTTPLLRSPPDQMPSEFPQINKQQQQPHSSMSSLQFAMGCPENMPSTSIPTALPPLSASSALTPTMNGLNGVGPESLMMEGLAKNSPNSNIVMSSMVSSTMAPPGRSVGTPQEGDGDAFNLAQFGDNDQNDAAAILQIKESMQQDVKRFESIDGDGNDAAVAEGFAFMP